MKHILIAVALQALTSQAEECDPDLFKSLPPDAFSTSLDCPTATFVGVQPAKVVCSGQTTTTTLVWTYIDCEPTACLPLPDGQPIPLDNTVDLGSGPKTRPLDIVNSGGKGKGTGPGGPDGTVIPGPGPTDILPNPAGSSVQPLQSGSLPPGSLPTDILPNSFDPTATRSGVPQPFGSSSNPIPPLPTTDNSLGPFTTTYPNSDDPSILVVTSSSNPPLVPTSSGSSPDGSIIPLTTGSDESQTTIPIVTSSDPPLVPTSGDPLPPESTTDDRTIRPFTRTSIDPLTSTTSSSSSLSSLTSSSTTSSTSSSSSAGPSPSCSDVPNGDFPDGVLAPWYISDQVTADSSTVVETEGQDDHPYAFALIPSQDSRAQVYLNNYLPGCGDPPPAVTLQISFDYQFTGESEGCSIAVAVNRSPDNLVTVTDDGATPGEWQSFQGEPITVQLTYDPLFTVKLLCEGDTANMPAILVTDIKAYA